MGFKEAKRRLIESLINMKFVHYEDRPIIWIKNRLSTGDVDVEFVLSKIKKCTGDNHKAEPGCAMADDNCMHRFIMDGWYIKYFLSNFEVQIVSVHEEA